MTDKKSEVKSPESMMKSIRHRRNKEFWWAKAARLLYYKLVIPIHRGKDSPRLIAYSVAIGLFVGFTPSVGFQMPLLAVIWWIALKGFNFHFSLLIAIAWSWLSNGATMIPLYYVFYVTGRFLLPTTEGDKKLSFADLSTYFTDNLTESAGMKESLYFLGELIEMLGSSLLVGSLPWAFGSALLGYTITLRTANSFQKIRAARMAKKKNKALE